MILALWLISGCQMPYEIDHQRLQQDAKAHGEGGGPPNTTASTGSTSSNSTSVNSATSTGPGGPAIGCGDGYLTAGEECDDGNQQDGDGCAGDCQLEGSLELCALSEPFHIDEFGQMVLWRGRLGVDSALTDAEPCSTSTYRTSFASVQSAKDGRLLIEIDPEFDGRLWITDSGCNPESANQSLGCIWYEKHDPRIHIVDIRANEPVQLRVLGKTTAAGSYGMRATILQP